MIIELFIFITIISFLIGEYLKRKAQNKSWIYINYFLAMSFFIAYCLINYSNYINYLLYVIFISLIIAIVFIKNNVFSTSPVVNLLIWMMLALSTLTTINIINSLYYSKTIMYSDAQIGDKGVIGEIGQNGTVLDNNNDYCYNQLVFHTEKILSEWKDNHNINYDKSLNHFNNMYLKKRYKRICKSEQYKSYYKEYGHYKTILFLQNKVCKWTNKILKYKLGTHFLEDHFSTDYHWQDSLLSKNIKNNEKISPFVDISNDPVWHWH